MTEAQMFQNAKVSAQQATDIAKKELSGTLSAIGFNDVNGKGIYEATAIGADGTASVVTIDTDTGAVIAKGPESAMGEEGNENGGESGGESGENTNG